MGFASELSNVFFLAHCCEARESYFARIYETTSQRNTQNSQDFRKSQCIGHFMVRVLGANNFLLIFARSFFLLVNAFRVLISQRAAHPFEGEGGQRWYIEERERAGEK